MIQAKQFAIAPQERSGEGGQTPSMLQLQQQQSLGTCAQPLSPTLNIYSLSADLQALGESNGTVSSSAAGLVNSRTMPCHTPTLQS